MEVKMKTGMKSERQGSGMSGARPDRVGRGRDWQRWAPYAAVVWSLVYAAMSAYWALSGRGFPYATGLVDSSIGPVAGRFGPGVAWMVVIVAGLPAVALGTAMLHGVRVLRPLLIAAGALLAGALLLLMTDLNLLALLAYLPYGIVKLITGEPFGRTYLKSLTQWTFVHQLLCLTGGFLWLAATVSYALRSGGACLYCARRDEGQGWTSPSSARRWGRMAVYAGLAVPVFYALTRYAWALGIPLGMSQERLRMGQEQGLWISGLSLATVGLLGGLLTLGLVQRWGEVFPRWMIGLAGRRVPIALAVVPAAIMSVLFMVTGVTVLSGWNQMAANAAAIGENIWVVVGPLALFPVWGALLAVATLGYYFRRRGPCSVCGRGAPSEDEEPLISQVRPSGQLPASG